MELTQSIDAGYEGYAQANMETLEMLNKALSAGSGVDAGSFTGGRALIPESMDTTLVNILHSQDDAILFKKLKKQPIKSPVHQWDQRTGVGAEDGAWVAEGADSIEGSQDIARKYLTAKYLQTLRKVTLQASISNMIEDAVSLEKNAGTLWIIRQVEKSLFYGSSANVSVQPDGLLSQIPTSNVVDIRGKAGSTTNFEAAITTAARTIRENYGKASDLFCSTMVMADVQALLRDRIRWGAGELGAAGSSVFTKYPTPFGTPELNADIFIQEGAAPGAGSTITASRPGQPTIASAVRSADALSKFLTGDNGNYYYKVVGVNQYGDSIASAESTVVAVQVGDKVTLTITDGSPVCTAYKIFRTKKDGASGSTVLYCFTAPKAATVIDYNEWLPGTSQAFVLTMDSVYDAIEWAQFLPLMKFDLFPTNAAVIPFLMLLFGGLAVKKPVQHVVIKNISPSTLGWYA
jgi:hypothetical protein